MADMTITGDAKFGSVINEMKRVEKSSDSMKRKVDNMSRGAGSQGRGASQRGGMGVLEISRGVEDFAVAGMRGLLNNIPGIIMSLGGGMGLAGAVSLAAVGITLFGKKLLELTGIMKSPSAKLEDIKKRTDAYAAANMKAKDSLVAFNAEQARALRTAKSEAAISETIRRTGAPEAAFNRSTENATAGRQIRDTLEAARNSLKEAMGEEVKIKLPNVADVEEDLATASKLLDDINKKASALEMLRTGISDSQKGQNFGIQFADVEAGIARATADIEFFRKRAEDAKAEMKSFGNEFADLASGPFNMTPADRNDPLSPLVRDGETLYKKFLIINKESTSLAKKAEITKVALEEQKRILEDGAKSRADQLAAIEKELEANAENSAAASKRLEEAKRELNLRKELLEIEKKRAQYGELNDQPSVRDFMLFQAQEAKRIEAAFKDIDSVLSRMGLAGGDMLSSSGKIGGSVTEYNSAIATINYQRDTLKELRTIARNTAKKQQATFN